MTPFGMRLWKKVLFQFAIALLLLVSVQVVLIILLIRIGVLPQRLADISFVQLVVMLFGSVSFAMFLITVGPQLLDWQSKRSSNAHLLGLVVPEQILHGCIVFPFGRQYVALGYITLSANWQTQIRQILSALAELSFPVTLVAAHSLEKQKFVFLEVRCVAETREEVINNIGAACLRMVQSLVGYGVSADWVQDSLGVEQLYWLCILGKDFNEDVLLQCEEDAIVAQVGGHSPRWLIALDLLGDDVFTIQGADLISKLSFLFQKSVPMYIALNLSWVSMENITHRLRQAVTQVPETGLLVEALGEEMAAKFFTNMSSPLASELVLLLRGRKEGLWQCSLRCICPLPESPRISEMLEWLPKVLGCRGFVETATSSFTFTCELPTQTILSFLEYNSNPREE